MIKDDGSSITIIKESLLRNQFLGAVLIIVYCATYGITSQLVLSSWQMLYFITSIIFALSIVYIKDKQIQVSKIKKALIANQTIGTALIFAYVFIYGLSSFAILSGFQLVFFMSSYIFAMGLIYIHNSRLEYATVSVSSTSPFFTVNSFINLTNEELTKILSDINNSLTTIIGFSELMLNRNCNENEKEYMTRSIFEKSISISHSVNKISSNIPDSITNPKPSNDVDASITDK